MQQLRQYPDSEPSSSREPRVPRIPDRQLRQGEVENSESSEISETSENIFPRFSAPSFPFCTSLYPKRKTRSWKTSEFDQCASEKTPRFSTSGFEYGAKYKTPRGKTDSLRFPSQLRCFTNANSQSPKRVVCRSV